MVSLTVNETEVRVEDTATILDAARQAGARVPILCYLENINHAGACRVCVVEVEGCDQLIAACNTRVWEGMTVLTDSPRVILARRRAVELILSRHDASCTSCARNGNCELQALCTQFGLTSSLRPKPCEQLPWPDDAPFVRDAAKCIQCMRCVKTCETVQGIGAWKLTGSGTQADVQPSANNGIWQSHCVWCGQCVINCPTGALVERDDTEPVLQALADPDTVVVAQIAPAVRVAWGEEFGLSPEEASADRLAGTLRRIGFDHVFDTALAADFTVMEEGSEFIGKLTKGDGLPLFTSCCPGWYRFAMTEYPQIVKHLSSVKSPQQMLGALLRPYLAAQGAESPKRIFSVSVMPCIAKKFESVVDENGAEAKGFDVDVVLTTRELARLIRAANVNPTDIDPAPFDASEGAGSGAGVIFGLSGGVTESALRTVFSLLEGRKPQPNEFRYRLKPRKSWREGSFEIGGRVVRVAVASGLANARELVEALLNGEASYDFVEIMACPGGCVGGGGQPITARGSLVTKRAEKLADLDIASQLRFSHKNPVVERCYREFLEKPLSAIAHQHLHVKGSEHE